jgi:S1/P1 Nuclease
VTSATNDLNVDHWIQESFDAAKQTSDKSPPIGAGAGAFTVTLAYKTAARNLAEKRIALAGARLAKILNEELK